MDINQPNIYYKIMLLVMEFLSNHEYTNEISAADIFNFIDDLEQLFRAENKKK